MTKKFHLVLGLHISPDFSEAEAGRAPPPRVDHDKVDFQKLRAALKATFQYGPGVEILVPNDTIDQLTVHMRFGTIPGVPAAPTEHLMSFRDFGEALLELVGTQSDGIIDVREAWKPKHWVYVRDRSYAPPPVVLPFVVVAEDFADAIIWQANTRPALELELYEPFEDLTPGQAKQDGRISQEFQESLLDIFGCRYEAYPSLVYRMAMDKAPAWAAQN